MAKTKGIWTWLGVSKLQPLVDRLDLAIIAFFIILMGYHDVIQNKLLDLGSGYDVTVFIGTTVNVLIVWWITYLLLFIGYAIFVMKRVNSRDRQGRPAVIGMDIVVGFFAAFWLAVAGIVTFLMTKEPYGTIQFFQYSLQYIDLYHISYVVMQGLALFYFLLTE